MNGKSLATIKVEYVFSRSLRIGPENLHQTTYPDWAKGNATLDSPLYQTMSSNGTLTPIVNTIETNPSLMTDLAQPKTAEAFFNACSTLTQNLQADGLNQTDSVFFRVKYLENTVNSLQSLGLSADFWTRCVPENQVAKNINIYDDVHTTVPFNASNAAVIGKYIYLKGNDPDDASTILAMLNDSVGWTQVGSPYNGLPLDRSRALSALESIPATTFECSLPIPVENFETDRPGVTMFLRNGNDPDMVLALESPAGSEGTNAQITFVTYRAPTAAEFARCTSYAKEKKENPPIAKAGTTPPI